jgi:hypothetical protein
VRATRLAAALLLAAAAAPAAAGDVPKANAKAISLVNRRSEFEAMVARVDPVVRELAEAPDAERRAVEDRLVSELGQPAIEVLVRYREPHLIPALGRLTEHEDWAVRRLAILGLQRNVGLSELDRIVARLGDGYPLVREIAASTIAILHGAGRKHRELVPRDRREMAAAKDLGRRRKADLAALRTAREKEENPYVVETLTAAIETFGRRPLLLVHVEPAVGDAPVRRVPRTEGAEVNAYASASRFDQSGGGRLRKTSGWAYPLQVYPREIMTIGSDRPLVPLPSKRDSLHFGHDCGWFLEGASIHAVADGVVRWVRSGGDWGVLVVVEYLTEEGEKVVGLNGHCGMWVFAKPGESVRKGQMIATMGLSFSPENGGHGAHDHFGMYEGAFEAGHCYGRSAAGRSTESWLVPPEFLTPRVEGENVAPESYR